VAARLEDVRAVTLHRLLGVRPSGGCRHGRDDPLSADVVVVDEMSMVDLPMTARLLEAVRPDARLVLVGDPSQLASVEAGAVLGDVVGTRRREAPASVRDNVVRLRRVHRFGAGSPIAALAAAIDDGDEDRVLALLGPGVVAEPDGGDAVESVRGIDPDDADAVAAVVASVVGHAVRLTDLARSGDAAGALAALRRLQVLAATRRGALGVQDWNQRVDESLSAWGRLRARWSAGRPVMVTANDHLNGVFNGDVGVVVVERGRTRVAFEGPDGARLLDPFRLDRYERLWAMTIHKSQGSEYDEIVVTLPPPPSPILTRELLYTAVTRARRRVTVIATEDAVRAAVARPVARSSGLAARLA
jgi:exodeoxyribonuclease V alpha subunit